MPRDRMPEAVAALIAGRVREEERRFPTEAELAAREASATEPPYDPRELVEPEDSQ